MEGDVINMAVKIGNSYVTEAAVAYAQARKNDEKSENILSDLSKQFPDVNFSVGAKMFSGSGTNNFSIAPNILRQMANDPEKKLEYEALKSLAFALQRRRKTAFGRSFAEKI